MQTHQSINRTAINATLHCLTGCAIGEILGLVVGTTLLLSNTATISLAVVLAFIFGYSFTLFQLLRSNVRLKTAIGIALAADTLSILVMEIVDNTVILAVPGAMNAGLNSALFWSSLAFALFIAFWAAFPLNRYLLLRGKGHALVHGYHHDNH